MRILFLDIDGVLTRELQRTPEYKFTELEANSEQFRLLNEVLQVSGAELVITSSWRRGRNITALSKRMVDQCGLWKPIYGYTPILPGIVPGGGRGHEIAAWLYAHWQLTGRPITEFVILDDGSDMLHLSPYLLQTDPCIGLTKPIADTAIRRFLGAAQAPLDRGAGDQVTE